MKHLFSKVFFLVISVLSFTGVSAQHKIGYINMSDLIAVMPETRQAQHTLQAYADSLARAEGGITSEFATKRDAFFRDSATMDSAKKEAQRKVLQRLIQQDQEFRVDAKSQLDSAQQALTAAVEAKAEDAVTATAKANGYVYVFRKMVSGEGGQRQLVILGPDRDDLLPLVKKQLGLDEK